MKKKNPFSIDFGFGKGVLNNDFNFGFPKEGILGGNNSINFNQKAKEGRALLRNDFSNLRKYGSRLRSPLGKNNQVSYYVLTIRDGTTIKHTFNSAIKAKQFKELAEASGSYDRVSNAVNEQL